MRVFVGKGEVYLHDVATRKKAKQVLWGDWLDVIESDGDWHKVRWGKVSYWIPKKDCIEEAPLDVIILDVGQGDGSIVTTPGRPDERRVIVVDAGKGDNVYRFIKWRYGKYAKDVRFHAAVATHSDLDHYLGFQRLLDEPKQHFERFYHNGIAEREGDDLLGPSDPSGRYLTSIMVTHADIQALYSDPVVRGRKTYPRLMHTALTSGKVDRVEMLASEVSHGMANRHWMPGFSPAENPDFTIEILGPLIEAGDDGSPRLRWFGKKIGSTDRDEGKTKNGHSVILRVAYQGFTLVLGGDLNKPAEDFLLRAYSGIGDGQPLRDAVAHAQSRWRSDLLKCCHHGAADVTDEFLEAVNPSAFAVSSGDDESYVHPRPELLGRLGRFGRGDQPLILCTEILRSTREREATSLFKTINQQNALIEKPGTNDTVIKAAKAKRAAALEEMARRNVQVYGAINIRTDGKDLAIAFLKERAVADRWHIYWYRQDEQKGFIPIEK
ncbi:hypothetical protein [Ensifer sp.]|jgi:beta-lactamase superfamily II metal-dependent hydrolase|uniref:ComEC/Rec2 family competence protein n=1 Tax=Ensifer sp. TaxID=1872086 RepID=UPI002E1685E4|nr:hypothetical protein [Ensifer sp.]